MKNFFDITMPSDGRNEAFARSAVAAFSVICAPTVEEINDLKTAVSEAVTNAIVHAYPEGEIGIVKLHCEADDEAREVTVTVDDFGKGIENLDEALEPFFTTSQSEERSGMGFTIIQTFTDEMRVSSKVGEGTTVFMRKVFKSC